MKTISARMFLLTGALICLSGCGNILGTGGKSTLYRISSTPVPEREIARQSIPVYITRPTLPPGADGDRILTIDRKSTRLNPVTNAHLVCRLLLEKKKKTSL